MARRGFLEGMANHSGDRGGLMGRADWRLTVVLCRREALMVQIASFHLVQVLGGGRVTTLGVGRAGPDTGLSRYVHSRRRFQMPSAARKASAPMVDVELTAALLVNELPSTRNKFSTSYAWCHSFTTEVFGSRPMRAVPSRWNAGWMTPLSRTSIAIPAYLCSYR